MPREGDLTGSTTQSRYDQKAKGDQFSGSKSFLGKEVEAKFEGVG